jgi:glycine betaine/proline transport system permease protein
VTTASVPMSMSMRRRLGIGWQLLIVLVVWVILWQLLFGRGNLEDGVPAFFQDWFTSVVEWVDAGRLTSPLFVYVLNPLSSAITSFIEVMGTVVFNLGWTGMTALATAIALVVAGWRYAVLACIGFLSFGLLGQWDAAMETLVLIVVATVLALVIGIPLGILAGVNSRFNGFLTPILDTMQILPTFAYLPIITLFFLIGPASAVIATIIFAAPPVMRLTSTGIRDVSRTTLESSRSLGATKGQVLRGVQLPMAKRAIVLGINQTVMAGLAMVTLGAVIGAGGLGAAVLQALSKLDVGDALVAGLAIVSMAIVFDRTITAASRRAEIAGRSRRAGGRRRRLLTYAMAVAIFVVGIVLPGFFPATATWPESWILPIVEPINEVEAWIETNLSDFTTAIANFFTTLFINPLESLLTNSPFLVVMAALSVISFIIGKRRVAITTLIALAVCIIMGLWPSSMVTLTQVTIGALLTMALGVLFGVWIGRSDWADRILRPILDAAQVMPPFVYLVPCLALFGPTRFTAIVAAIVYAAPVVIKVVGEGIRGVPANSIEAAMAAGSNSWQQITKVQLPMSRSMLMVALNQGVVFVFSMVVIGGLVGGGGLGYAVVEGFSQARFAGIGIAAGIAIVALGVMMDRITQAAGADRRPTVAS